MKNEAQKALTIESQTTEQFEKRTVHNITKS